VSRAIITSQGAERIGTALSAARARSPLDVLIGHVEAYCHHADCAVRVVSLEVKEHDDPLPPRLRCPACRRLLKLHSVQTREERMDADEADARRSVNAQLWERAHLGEAVPIGALLDDTLPGDWASTTSPIS